MTVPELLAQWIADVRRLKPRIARTGLHPADWAALLGAIGLLFLALHFAGGLGWGLTFAGALAVMAMTIMAPGSRDDDRGDAADGSYRDGSRTPDPGSPRERVEDWRAILDAMPDAALVLDHAGLVVHHNVLVRDLFVTIRAGQPLRQMSRNPELNDAVSRAAASGETVVVELDERVPVERRISAQVSRLSGVKERKGQPILLVTFRDLTEQDRLAQMRADFIANASHELRTPLASLRGFVETLQGPARDDPAARERFLGIMASQANRMTRLIDDLLSLSRVEMRVHLPPKGIVDLNEIATYVAQAMEPLAEASKTEIRVKTHETPARIRGDRDEIVQVVQNLAHNAIKYGREGGHVEIAVSRVVDGAPPAERLLLAVADDGIGIAREHLPRLTERFYRANVAASRDKGGTGLGLAIVKHIVLRHRGDLRIASELGKGSTFSVLFDATGRG